LAQAFFLSKMNAVNAVHADPMLFDMRSKTMEVQLHAQQHAQMQALHSASVYLKCENKLMDRTCKLIVDLEEALRYRNLHLAAEHTALVQVHRKLHEVLSLRRAGQPPVVSDDQKQHLQGLQQQLWEMSRQAQDPVQENMVTELQQAVRQAQERMQFSMHQLREREGEVSELGLPVELQHLRSLNAASGLAERAAEAAALELVAKQQAVTGQLPAVQQPRSRVPAATSNAAGCNLARGPARTGVAAVSGVGFAASGDGPSPVAPTNVWQTQRSSRAIPLPEELAAAGPEGFVEDEVLFNMQRFSL